MFKWFIQQYPSATEDPHIFCNLVAASGNVEVMKWCLAQGYEYVDDIFKYAINSGNVQMLEYLFQIGVPIIRSPELTCVPAMNGNLDILKWLHQNGCLADSFTSYFSAINGHLEIFKWFQSINCEWNESVWVTAIKYGKVNFIEYLADTWQIFQPIIQRITEISNLTYNDVLCITQWIHTNRKHFTHTYVQARELKEIVAVVRNDSRKHQVYFKQYNVHD